MRSLRFLATAVPGSLSTLALASLLAALPAAQAATAATADADTVDVGTQVPKLKDIQQGLFPDDECEQLKANGFKCMGFKPPVRFSLPSASFQVGSAELPVGIQHQLDVFAEALKGKTGASRAVRIEGHADASGSEDANATLSQKRADAARAYLIRKGVAADLLKAVGVGSKAPLDAAQPLSARNRRVVIGREQSPAASAPQ